jgi:DNA polymerase-3 subunit beta
MLFKEGFAVSNNGHMAIAVALPELGKEIFLVPHKNLLESLKYIPASTLLEITSENSTISVKGTTGGFATNLRSGEAVNFPDFPVFEKTGGGEVDGDALVNNLKEVVGYASKQVTRPVLTGVCFTLGDQLEVAAADGNRLAWRTLPIRLLAVEDQPPRVVIPAQAFRALERLWKIVDKKPRPSETFEPERLTSNPHLHVASLASARRYIDMAFGDTNVSFDLGEATLASTTIVGDFPDYSRLIPEKATHSVLFDAGEAYRAVRQLTPMLSAKGSTMVRLEWRRDSLTFKAASQDLGEAEVCLDAKSQGRASRMAFNYRFLLEVLKDKDGPILLETVTPTGPGRFTHHASPNILVMSMATTEAREAAEVAAESDDDLEPEGE